MKKSELRELIREEITKLKTMNLSESNVQYFYHPTLVENIENISKNGLTFKNQVDILYSEDGVSLIDNIKDAFLYGDEIWKDQENLRFTPVIRVKLNKDNLIQSKDEKSEYIVKNPVRKDLEIFSGYRWLKLTPKLGEIIYTGEWMFPTEEDKEEFMTNFKKQS